MLEMLLATTAARFPERTALVYGDRRVSYGQLAEQAALLRQGLASLGLAAGDSVAVLLPNSIEFVVSFYALVGLGAVVVPVNPLLSLDELRHHCADNRVRAIITAAQHADLCRAALAQLDERAALILTDAAQPGAHALQALLTAAAPELPRAPVDAAAPAVCMYSSGSTGRPKRVIRTQANLRSEADQFVATARLTADDVILGVVPLFHAHGLGNCLLAAGRSGAALVLLEAPVQDGVAVDLPFVARCQRVVELIERERVSVLPAVPTIVSALAGAELDGAPALGTLRLCFSAGNFLPEETARAFVERFGVPVRQLYGCTEAGAVAINLEDGPGLAGSVGRPLRDSAVVIVDERRRALPAGQVGEIAIRGPGLTAGYVGMDALNQEVFRDGFFYTGDLGRLDAAGRLFITGRQRIFIDVGGRKVDPLEVEAALAAHPAVREAVVVGMPAIGGGEWAKAVVVPHGPVSQSELLRHCAAKLAGFKVPRAVEFREALPRSPLGKILRKHLIDAQPSAPPTAATNMLDRLADATNRRARAGIVAECLRQQLAELVGVEPAQVRPHAALSDFGLDSARAVELQARLQALLGVTLSATMVWQHPSLGDLTAYVVDMLEAQRPADPARPELPDAPAPEAGAAPPAPPADPALFERELEDLLRGATPAASLDEIDQLSDDAVTQLLLAELDKLQA